MHAKSKLHAAALAALAVMSSGAAHANITIETVTVGNPGNAADTTGYGAVAYTYQIGKYEVTNAQYAAFLNAVAATDAYGLYHTDMNDTVFGGISRAGSSGSYSYSVKSGFENKPVVYVSFWDAARFTNWLNNGQGSASTESGSYTLGGVANPLNSDVTRNSGAAWAVASENEWYKAAYYDPAKSSGAGGYWLLPWKSDTPTNNTSFSSPSSGNFNDGDYVNGGYAGPGTTDVGFYINALSHYGTYDQGGNAYEWNETIRFSDFRGARGGYWDSPWTTLRASSNGIGLPDETRLDSGFRVVSLAPIPEPSAFAALTGGMALAGAMLRRRKRSAS